MSDNRLPLQLLFKYRPEDKLKKKAMYHPSAPFSLTSKIREIDPVSLLDYWWLFLTIFGVLFSLIILFLPV